MPGFLAAHGYAPGPTQRPLVAGLISGLIASLPAIVVLEIFHSLRVEATILGLSPSSTIGIGWLAMALAGAVYAQLFGRAANDRRGGWLFGMSFGFALWAAGAVMVIPLIAGGRAPAGQAAVGVFLSLIVWGLALGTIFPFIHRPLHEQIDKAARRMGPHVGMPKIDRRRREAPRS